MEAVLRWMEQEGARFCGDPGRVTVLGESAGAGAVAALIGVLDLLR